jgi:glycyl-tRNA synthetase beta chain
VGGVSADFLLELRSEEIPARMQAGARNDLARLFAQELDALGVAAEAIDVWSTPRRLALVARGLPLETQAVSEELKGPRTSAPEQALDGFLRKTGLTREQLEDRDGVWFAVVQKPGQAMRDLLGPIVEKIVAGFPWPKSMRWGAASDSTASLRWVRPLHGIVALLGEDIVTVQIDGIEAGATTVGHRFHHPGPITIGGAHDYAEKLRACHVIVDQDERERIVREGAAKSAAEAKLQLVTDEGLVVENAGLTEWPVPLLGRFDPDYLDVPREVIVLTMRTNQKYFACTGDEGALAPAFVCVANIDAKDGGGAIVEGNRRVLAARLSDARFFWEQDLKVPLEEQRGRLSGIVFHEKLGTLGHKADRLKSLVDDLAPAFSNLDREAAQRAGLLSKSDLVSGMVGEFPELQGVMGRYYAERQGESLATAEAIEAQYKPLGPTDLSPSEPVSVAVALADKIDSLVGFFGIGERPTGSKDPFALRRAALGAIRLIVENDLRVGLNPLFRAAAQLYRNQGIEVPDKQDDLVSFFADRLKVQQRDAGVRHDLIDAVFALGGEDDLVRLLARVKALQSFVEGNDGADLLTAYKRAANILKKEKWEATSASGGADMQPEEAALVAALDSVEPQAGKAVDAEDFTGAMRALAQLRGPIDAFFEKVTVNDPDTAKRERRLNLLARFRDAVNRVADFSKIEG